MPSPADHIDRIEAKRLSEAIGREQRRAALTRALQDLLLRRIGEMQKRRIEREATRR